MNHYVPDFEMDDDYPIPSHAPRKKFPMDRGEDDFMELLWQNGHVVMQSQRPCLKKSQPSDLQAQLIQTHQSSPHQIPHDHHHHQNQNLFMQEDEMASWLHYPLNDTPFVSDLCSDLICIPPSENSTSTASATAPASVTTAAVEVRMPPVPAVSKPPMPPLPTKRIENFGHFARLNKPRVDEPGPSSSKRAANDSTVVDSSDTPAAVIPRFSQAKTCEIPRSSVAAAFSAGEGMRDTVQPCELTETSSPGGSSASAEPPPLHEKTATPQPSAPPPDDRKRKAREAGGGDETEWQSEDVELESADGKKQLRGSTSTKRSRAAEVHNLSERRRRDRINEKMKALQELIPHCNKADKASMLDEAIEYLKSLQLQVQMMSMGCSMVPMMFPGVQQYMPNMRMGIGMGMGMGMGMEMGMNHPMMPFPGVLAGTQIPATAAGANMGLRFPMPAFRMAHVLAPDPSRVSPNVQSELMRNSPVVQNPSQPKIPNLVDPYTLTQYLSMHNMQLPPQQQQIVQPDTSKLSTTKGAEDVEKRQPG